MSLYGADAPVVSDIDLLKTAQSYKAAKRNLSVTDKTLSIKGKAYKEGIGSHAVSMIPIDVPSPEATLTGAVGVDDGGDTDKGSVRFHIYSGSEILWSSPEMKKGMDATTFSVKVPVGAKKLYLFADDLGNSYDDHADWVDLKWTSAEKKSKPESEKKTLNAADFGLTPNVEEDQGPALRKAISALRAHPGVTLNIPKGSYHFYREGALALSYHISNHDQPAIQPVCIPLIDLENVTIEGNGSKLLFHNYVQPVSVIDSKKVTLNNVSIDYPRSNSTEATVLAVSDTHVDISIDPKVYPYEVRDGKLVFKKNGEDWERGPGSAIIFEKDTDHIVANTSDVGGLDKPAEDLGQNKIRMAWDHFKKMGIQPGDVVTIRCWERPHPAVVVYRADDTVLNDVSIHNTLGMGILAQRSTNITFNKGGVYPSEGRVHSAEADATHYSNTAGLILSEEGLFDGMMDDAINVHSTCLSIEKIESPTTILCKYMHGQSIGFETFLPGENLRFIAGKTLENKDALKVKNAEKLSSTELRITLEKPMPDYVQVGDAVENADYQPEVIFRGNTVRNNRARGSLFTTPKRVLVEKNNFDHSSGSAILLAGDAQGWYESGPCYEVIIRENIFTNNLTSRYQFTNALIAIYPEVRNLDGQKDYYHRNVLIENNTFNTFDVPLLFAISTDNIQFKNNIVDYNDEFKSWNQKPFKFIRCNNILIEGNDITPAKKWTLEDVDLEKTPSDAVKILQ